MRVRVSPRPPSTMTVEQQHLIDSVAAEVRSRLEGEGSGHDWWHIVRVWNMAKHLCDIERADFLAHQGL